MQTLIESGQKSQKKSQTLSPIELGCDCPSCPFSVNSAPPHTPVFGVGPSSPTAIIVGESPGTDEVSVSKPFVGQTGRALDRVLGQVGLAREKLFIVNAVLCQPTDKTSRRMAKAVKCCSPAFEFQIKKFREQKKHFLLMGKYAALAYYKRMISLEKGRGFIRS